MVTSAVLSRDPCQTPVLFTAVQVNGIARRLSSNSIDALVISATNGR